MDADFFEHLLELLRVGTAAHRLVERNELPDIGLEERLVQNHVLPTELVIRASTGGAPEFPETLTEFR